MSLRQQFIRQRWIQRSTHSEEAIDKVLKCSPELQDKIKVFTLYKNDKETVVRALTAHKAIEIKDEMGLELR